MKFTIGQTVEWSSQAAGSTKTKRGRVVAVVPPSSKEFCNYLYDLGYLLGLDYPRRYDLSALDQTLMYGRKQESYIVEVEAECRHTKPRLYWPRVSALKLVAESA
jgi:hypothetical protein